MVQTHQIGGLLLEDNPWSCSCDLLWLSSWLRRWERETRKLRMLSLEELTDQSSLEPLKGHCTYTSSSMSNVISRTDGNLQPASSKLTSGPLPDNSRRIALIDLQPETIACSASHSFALLSQRLMALVVLLLVNAGHLATSRGCEIT